MPPKKRAKAKSKSKKQKEWEANLAWYEDHLKIVDKSGQLIPLALKPVQQRLEKIKWEAMRKKLAVFIVILKARQEGVSTWTEATFFKDSVEMSHRRSCVIAHDEKATRNILDMTRLYYEMYPEDENLESIRDSATSLKFKHNASSFMIYTAGARGRAARSFNFQALHMSELDFWEDADAVFGAIMQVIADKYPIVVVVESTANGPMGPMERLWKKAQEGTTEFIPVFFPWFDEEEYRRVLSWQDLAKYAEREWIDVNRKLLEQVGVLEKPERPPKEETLGLGRGHGGGGSPEPGGSRPGHEAAARDSGEGDQSFPVGKVPRLKKGENHIQIRRELEKAWTSTRRRIYRHSDSEREIVFDRSGMRHDSSAEMRRAVREDDSDESRREREHLYPDPAGGDHGSPRQPLLGSDDHEVTLREAFEDSLTSYERGLIEEFDLKLVQINWLRYCLHTKCHGDDVRRRREFPSRWEESFEATGSDILDPYVLAKWERFAKDNPCKKCSLYLAEPRPEVFHVEREWDDPLGKIEIYELPDPKRKYVMAVDPAQGVGAEALVSEGEREMEGEEGDWTVACVLDQETGDQVAEYRSKADPDIAIDQIEALGFWFNRAWTGVEVNGGFGRPFVVAFTDQGLLPMYERDDWTRYGGGRVLVKKKGWNTDQSNRTAIFTEMKRVVRTDQCQVRSKETLSEMRTLWEKRVGEGSGRIEHRPGCHDDGVMAYGIALRMRNMRLVTETRKEEEDRKKNSFVAKLDARERKLDLAKGKKFAVRTPAKVIHIRSPRVRPDGRRSVI